jgi:signal transduction histidine kinase/ligand-binding sensor domain-containing protein/DNA-binding NarL/FixJ family response regulator
LKFFNLLFCISFVSFSFSQSTIENDSIQQFLNKQISFNNLTVENGLSQNSVVSIAQDSIGYLWFATQDGLNKYDGTSFKIFKKQFDDITKNNYSKLGKVYVDRQNEVWITTSSGVLEKYNAKNEAFEIISNIKSVSTVFQDSDFNIYLGTDGFGLFKINTISKDTIQLFEVKDIGKTINQIIQNKNEIIVTASNSVFKFEKGSPNYQEIPIKGPKASFNFSSISIDNDETLFIGTYGNGLYYKKINDHELNPFEYLGSDILPNNLNIEASLIDKRNRLWIATYGQGIYILDIYQKTIENFVPQENNPVAFHYNDALCLFEDNSGTIWIGTDGGGISYYDEHLSKFNLLTSNQTPENVFLDVVRAISVNKDQDIWIGTSGKGLTYINLNKKKYKTYNVNNSNISSNRIMSLRQNDDDLWIGHQGSGLNILSKNGVFSAFNQTSKIKLEANTIWCIFNDSQNNIWLGTRDNGLILFDKNKGEIENHVYNKWSTKSLSSNNVRIITEGDHNLLWIGTDDKGLCSLNLITKEINRYDEVPYKIKSLYFDKDTKNLWIGTNGDGLILLNTVTFEQKKYIMDNGLPNNVIYSVIPDNDNNLWLSSNKGITKFPIDTSKSNIVNYDNYDGLQAFEFNTGAYFKNELTNEIYFGGLKGINWFNPHHLTINPTKPKTIISKFEIFANEMPLVQAKDYRHNQNTVSFTFSSLHFSQPDRNLYKYKLENHDEDWIESGNVNSARYTNLPPNSYEFKVISCNYDGIWNENPAIYKFTIKKPWYLNNLAWTIYVLLIFTTALFIYKYFKWRWQMKLDLQFEYAEKIRLKDLNDFKTKLYTNISHEFRTPLTLILSPTENQLSKNNISEDNKKDLLLIQRNSKRLLNLVDQLLDLARLESGHLKLKVENDNLSMLLNQLASSFQYKAQKKQIEFKTNIAKIPDVWFDKDIIEKIVSNLLSNAIKYTPEKGKVHFSTTVQKNHAIITVLNNGSKIKSEDLSKLFTRFYQVNTNADGVGIGLALVKELVALTNGTLVANTINNDEIQFTVNIPINKEAFKSNDIKQPTNKPKNLPSFYTQKNQNPTEDTTTDKPVILIVEDDKDVKNYIESILKNNYKIRSASNGKSGIKKALDNIPDLILSDIMMPKTDGIELCQTLKSNMLTSHIPIILLTAKVGDENEIKALEVGADDYITKPFKSKILVKRITNLINSRKNLQLRYTQHSNLKAKDLAITSMDEDFLNQVEVILNKHLSEPDFNAVKFSKLMLVSRMQLHRKIIALTGLSTTSFIRSQRLKKAMSLLINSDFTISEIAYQVGFNTPSYFIKCFKKSYGYTPNDYISRM